MAEPASRPTERPGADVLVLIAAVPCGWYADRLRRQRIKRQAIASITSFCIRGHDTRRFMAELHKPIARHTYPLSLLDQLAQFPIFTSATTDPHTPTAIRESPSC